MFLQVKRLQEIQDLLLENDLIRIGNDIASMISSTDQEEDQSQAGPTEDTNLQMDKLLDWLISLGEAVLSARLGDPIFRKTFGDPQITAILNKYFRYILDNIDKVLKAALLELVERYPSKEVIGGLKQKLLIIATRVQVLELIYTALSKLDNPKFALSVLKSIEQIKLVMTQAYEKLVVQTAESTQKAQTNYENAQEGTDEKESFALSLVKYADAAKIITSEVYDESETGGLEEKITAKMNRDEVKRARLQLEEETSVIDIIKSLFNLRYQTYQTEELVRKAVGKIRVRINDLEFAKPEVKDYLNRNVDLIETELLERIKNKSFDTSKFKGIHYDFNKKLPLYTKTPLPVTGKQIADEHILTKFKKIAAQFGNFVLGEAEPMTDIGRGYYETGKMIGTAYAKTVNWTAKKIGKAIKGREGEIKADALTRLFVPTAYLDDEDSKKKETNRGVLEDAVTPGVTPQVPGSIGGAGPIEPPTQNSIGSGDKFNSSIINKKKKKGGILDFKTFLKENNNK